MIATTTNWSGFDAEVEREQVKQQAFAALQSSRETAGSEGQTVDETEEKREEIDQWQAGRVFDLAGPLEEVIAGGGYDRQRDQEFDQPGIDVNKVQCAEVGQMVREWPMVKAVTSTTTFLQSPIWYRRQRAATKRIWSMASHVENIKFLVPNLK